VRRTGSIASLTLVATAALISSMDKVSSIFDEHLDSRLSTSAERLGTDSVLEPDVVLDA
jgi:hypothetical protein